ncbi:Uncharacterised protein [BD1-7 clade bacterium]|uniref:Lipoprotein n=1 Tax=BD1-7 clade bacterium TaxID=2029982 RepID=A0A5S9PGB0_9GAMM|nr:Uncharacterised protein [BD1-7 clade bacterium]CAA0103172.1 Uncharacterised protein [BD1-7 clade bacterium]
MIRWITAVSAMVGASLLLSACLPSAPPTPKPEPEPPAPQASDARDCDAYIIPYMPFSVNSSQLFYAANVPNAWSGVTSSPSSDISVDVIDDQGTHTSLGQVAVVAPQQVVKLTTPITQALDAQGVTSTKLALRIQATNPENLYIYSAYQTGSDRAIVRVECVKE